MKAVFFLSFFYLSSLFPQDLTISYSSLNSLILKSKNCEELIKQHSAICEWKKMMNLSFDIPLIDNKLCQRSSNGFFKMTVSSCLPDFVKNYQHKALVKSGANCWGTALSFKKISNYPRFVWPQEMLYWQQDTPLCRKVSVGEEIQAGDIINIYGPEYVSESEGMNSQNTKGTKFWEVLFPKRLTISPVNEGYTGHHHFLHSETYLSKDLTFGKVSPAREDQFEFHLMKEVYGRGQNTECHENQSLEPYFREYQNPPKKIKGTKCEYFSLAYRCESLPDYFSKQVLDEREKEIQVAIQSMQLMQDQLFPLILSSRKTIPSAQIEKMVIYADQMALDALDDLTETALSKNTEMLLVLKYFTAAGIRKSLELARLIPTTERL